MLKHLLCAGSIPGIGEAAGNKIDPFLVLTELTVYAIV